MNVPPRPPELPRAAQGTGLEAMTPSFPPMGRLSNTDDGFQSGYRWLSVRGNGSLVAMTFCM